MMDPIIIGLIVVAIIGGAVYYYNSSKSESEKPVAKKAKAPAKPKAPVSERVAALKSADAVKDSPAAKKLPTKTSLLKLTKANIEENAREFDIELDKRMTKENMVQHFLKDARAAARAQRK